MSKIYVYVGEISDFCENDTLPPFAQEEIKRISNENAIKEKRGAWGLLKKAVKEVLGVDDVFSHIVKSKNGKPITNNYFLSISHSKDLVAVALSNENIGIDIEKVDEGKNFEKLIKYILSPQEKNLPLSNMEDLTRLWVKKEAKFKFDDGEKYFPKNIDTLTFEAKTTSLQNGNDKYLLSIVADNLENVTIKNLL